MRSLSAGISLSLLLGAAAGLWMFGGRSLADNQSDWVEMTMQDEAVMTDIQQSFPGAPEKVLAIAGKIAFGEAITARDLSDLGTNEINELWPNPALAKQEGAGQSLLRLAVETRNIPAVHALLDAGADPFYNDNEWPFQAIRMFQGSQLVWFPDYSPGVELLKIWLDHGGDPNARCKYRSDEPLLIATNPSNLEGVLVLLDAGADPWFQPRSLRVPSRVQDSFFEGLANATLKDNEVAFRIAQKGFYQGGSPEAVESLINRYDKAAKLLLGATGTENLWATWTMQQALPIILEQTGGVATPAISELLSMDVPPDIGGFFLAPDEIRSPDDRDQQARNDNQFGTERWGR